MTFENSLFPRADVWRLGCSWQHLTHIPLKNSEKSLCYQMCYIQWLTADFWAYSVFPLFPRGLTSEALIAASHSQSTQKKIGSQLAIEFFLYIYINIHISYQWSFESLMSYQNSLENMSRFVQIFAEVSLPLNFLQRITFT